MEKEKIFFEKGKFFFLSSYGEMKKEKNDKEKYKREGSLAGCLLFLKNEGFILIKRVIRFLLLVASRGLRRLLRRWG